jgi:hypothetical protein
MTVFFIRNPALGQDPDPDWIRIQQQPPESGPFNPDTKHTYLQVQVDPGATGEEVPKPEVQVRGG